MEPHPMKTDLDEGRLTSTCRDRKFTTFLDLKYEYHSEFIGRLRQHVQDYHYDWDRLRANEVERRSCAKSFVDRYGTTYWGTEANRKKYLLPDAFSEPISLCTYPARKDEIIRTMAILLERKANGQARTKEKNPEEIATPSRRVSASVPPLLDDSSYVSSTSRPSAFNDMAEQENAGNRTKRKASVIRNISPDLVKDESERRSQRPRTSTSTGILPFNSSLHHGNDSNPSRLASLKGDLSFVDDNVASSTVDEMVGSAEGKYLNLTIFLVEASNQEGMAPVRVPFENFMSAASFLAHMSDECQINEWTPNTQLLSESHDWRTIPTVAAASVKFEWSGFEIRVRPGKDQDWARVIEELYRAWKAKELNLEETVVQSFEIKVMLHVR
ncbi:hypothetical protein BBP40_005436 [Aspergillus hancockii]|nr:hypothetical protein BBP40_005436 [Aspergillus hancockii]